jgi:hypothetical protein
MTTQMTVFEGTTQKADDRCLIATIRLCNLSVEVGNGAVYLRLNLEKGVIINGRGHHLAGWSTR